MRSLIYSRLRAPLIVAAVAGGALASTGCGDVVPPAHRELLAAEAARTPEHVLFVFDRSGSIKPETLDRSRVLMNQRIGALTHGDQLTVMELLQRSLAEPPKRWSQPIPARERTDMVLPGDSVSRARFLRDAVSLLENFADSTGRHLITGTDILSTMHDIAADFDATPDHAKTLILFSDMLQSTPDIEMEGARRMPGSQWVFKSAAGGRLPDLTGVCVYVVGGRVDTNHGQNVKNFWKQYFDATGATLYDRNYSLRPVEIPTSDPCA